MKPALLTVFALFSATLSAQTRRAVIVGIDEYLTPAKVPGYQPSVTTSKRLSTVRGKPSRESLTTLDGAYNDATQMKTMLISRFGFKESDIVMLPNERQKATAENILGELQRHLIDEAQKNDISLFYYAGHGSRILNSLTTNVGGLDSTIIPQDSLLGVPDIRSKELARIYAEAPVKGIHLTVIQDSCYSGGGARGPFGATKSRAQPADEKVSVAEKFEGDLPEDRGVVILSASQDYQPAQELPSTDLGSAHGAFTWALLHVLGSSSPNERVDRIFQRTRALMQSKVDGQEPTMLAKNGHNELGLFGQPADSFRAATAAVTSVDKTTGEIQIAGGRAMNLYPGCELKRIVPVSPAIEIKVSQVTGLSSSTAAVSQKGAGDTVKAGDLFQLDKWVVPDSESLRVYMGPAVSMDSIRPLLAAIADLRKRPDLEWVDDPTQKTPTHLISWDAAASKWTVRANLPGAPVVRVEKFSADAIAAALPKVAGKPRVYALIPATPELASRIQVGKNSVNPAIMVVESPQTAEYVLLGRVAGTGVEYAWAVPGASDEDLQRQFAAARQSGTLPSISAWPLRTNWYAAADVEGAGKSLSDSALKLASIAGWLKLDSPKFETDFPYHLVLKEVGQDRSVEGGDVHDQEKYKLYLQADSLEAGRTVDRRRIYIFGVDSDGNGQLLFGSGNLSNEFPKDPQHPDPAIALTGREADIRIQGPFGIDTYLMVATAQPIDNPESIFTFKGVRTRSADSGSRGAGNPLERLLRSTGAGKRGFEEVVPTDWSVRRMVVRSLAAGQ
jgi:hypothetical protein